MNTENFDIILKSINKSKTAKTAFFITIVLIALSMFFLPGALRSGGKRNAESANKETAEENSVTAIEKKLEAVLETMRGTGNVKVMVTLERTAESIVASNEKNVTGEKNTSRESRPATVQSGGREEPIVLTEIFPKIRGVIVIAEGAGDISVKNNLISAVSTVLGIDEKNVEVFVMGG